MWFFHVPQVVFFLFLGFSLLPSLFLLSSHSLFLPNSFLGRYAVQWHPTPVLLPGKSHGRSTLVGCSPWGRKESDTTERLYFHALEEEMATHSSILAWRIPGTGEPGGLPAMVSHRVGHDWSDLAAAAAACYSHFCCVCVCIIKNG